jgi:hypothetical protein
MEKETKLQKIIRRAGRFSKLETAIEYHNRANKTAIIHGDDGYYWIVTLGEAELLHKNGYEYAPY